MDNTLSDYDLIDRMKKERQNEIDKLRAKNEKLREALMEIVELYKPQALSLTAIKMCMVAEQALNEVTK